MHRLSEKFPEFTPPPAARPLARQARRLTALAAGLLMATLLLPGWHEAAAACTTAGGCPQTAPPNCLQDELNFQTGTSNHLTCTAKDVKIAFASNPRDAMGNAIPSCIMGSTFSFIADFTVVTTATARENIGLYMATAGQGSALTGTCTDNIISPLHDPGSNTVISCSNKAGTAQCLGTSQYQELDASPDNCGDISTADNNQVITVAVNDVKCEPAPGCTGNNCQLSLPNCTSWQQPGGTVLCQSTPPTTGWPYVTAATPGSPSKCSCNSGFTVPIIVQSGSLTVSKSANPTSITGSDGGSSNYTVTATNNFNVGSVTVEQICDDQYGNIATAAGFAGPKCAAGKLCPAGSLAGSTCATNISCSLPATLAAKGNSVTCTFTGAVPENETPLTDIVTVNGITSGGTAVSGTANASVTTGDAPASATFIKTLGSANPTSGCATVIYDVEVDNSSAAGTDEDETLTSLSDDTYGDITTVHGNSSTNNSVTSTSCAVNQPIAVGGKYTCHFNGVVCSNSLGPIGSPGNCAAGALVTDTLTGTLTGDETGETVTVTPGSRTVAVCFAASQN